MPPTRSVPLPESVVAELKQAGRGLSPRIIAMALSEAQRGRPLAVIPGAQRQFVPVTVDAATREALSQARARYRIPADQSEGELLGRLVLTSLRGETPEDTPPATQHISDTLRRAAGTAFTVIRAEQIELARLIESTIHESGVALLESATGTGKGLVIAAAAHAVASVGGRALISAPTHAINAQTLSHLLKDLPQSARTRTAVLQGRGQFYSPTRLHEFLDAQDLLAGTDATRSLVPDHERAAARYLVEADLRKYAAGAREGIFRLESLVKCAPHIPDREVALGEGCQDQSEELYQGQFEAARAAGIVIATHAMVAHCISVERRSLVVAMSHLRADSIEIENQQLAAACDGGKLGRFDLALIDEAHLLEQIFADANSRNLSLFKLKMRMRQFANAECQRLMESAFESLSAQDAHDRDELLISSADERTGDAVRSALKKAEQAVQSTLKRRGAHALPPDVKALLERDLSDLRRGLDARRGDVTRISYSPDYRYPRLQIGPKSVGAQIGYLWARCPAAVLLSATLYTQDLNGMTSPSFMAARLYIPQRRMISHLPIRPSWVTDPVTVHAPDVSVIGWKLHPWTPPREHNLGADEIRSAKARYFDALGQQIIAVTQQARGGTLVLCTAYDAISAFAKALKLAGLGARLVESQRDIPLRISLEQYQEQALKGLRPIWLATGGAWTGLNVYPDGVSLAPEEDELMTDLIIPRLPLRLSGTSTEAHRSTVKASRYVWFDRVQQCSLTTMQGIGRLIRRPGLVDRHLWILDPRGFDPAFTGGGSLRSIWRRYKNHALISDDGSISTKAVMPAPTVARTAAPPALPRADLKTAFIVKRIR